MKPPRSRPMPHGRVLLSLLLACGILGIAGYGYYRFQGFSGTGDINAPIVHSVARGSFDHIVLERGEIESSSNIEIKCEVRSRGSSGVAILWIIDEGSFVSAGDKLVELDSSALEQDLKSQRVVVNNAEATVIGSDAEVRKAIISREEYLDGTYLNERKAILSEIAVAEQELRRSELSLSSAERLAARGTLKSLQIEAEQFSVKNATNNLVAAQSRLRVLDELTREKMLVQFDSDIERAKAKLESDRSILEEEKIKLAEITQQIAACTIVAPTDGQVVYANRYGGRGGSSAEFVVEPGAVVREQQTIINLPDPSKMQVRAKINESRVPLVRVGMPVKIRVGAVGGDLIGRVTKVNKYAEPGSWFSSAVKEYATFIQILDPPETIRTGMTAEVRIFVEQLPDAVQIPVHALHEYRDRLFVLVQGGAGKSGGWETRQVEIGASNEKFATIDEGLSEGELVVLNPRSHLSLMELPEVPEVDNRERLAGAAAATPQESTPAGETEAPDRSGAAGQPAGGMDAAGIVARILEASDTDRDGRLSREELAGNERLAGQFDTLDTNRDGFIDRTELTTAMQRMMRQFSGGGGPPGGGGGS